MNTKITALLIALALFALPVCALADSANIPAATEQFYANDFAEVLDADVESFIVNHARTLYEKTGAQIVVTTVNFIGVSTMEDYAERMFNTYQIGDAEKQNGVLLVLAMGPEDYWCTQGRGIIDTLRAGTLQLLLDEYLEPKFDSRDYSGGVKDFFIALYNELADMYGVDHISDMTSARQPVDINGNPSGTAIPEKPARIGTPGNPPNAQSSSTGFDRKPAGVAPRNAQIPQPTDMFYVYDGAGVLDTAVEEYIVYYNSLLFERTGAQIVIATVNDTGSTKIADYSFDLFNTWGIGDAQRNNGLLLLMSIDADDYWTLAGMGIDTKLDEDTLGDMLYDYLEPYFAAKDYTSGAAAFFEAAYSWFVDYYGVQDIALPNVSQISGAAA